MPAKHRRTGEKDDIAISQAEARKRRKRRKKYARKIFLLIIKMGVIVGEQWT